VERAETFGGAVSRTDGLALTMDGPGGRGEGAGGDAAGRLQEGHGGSGAGESGDDPFTCVEREYGGASSQRLIRLRCRAWPPHNSDGIEQLEHGFFWLETSRAFAGDPRFVQSATHQLDVHRRVAMRGRDLRMTKPGLDGAQPRCGARGHPATSTAAGHRRTPFDREASHRRLGNWREKDVSISRLTCGGREA